MVGWGCFKKDKKKTRMLCESLGWCYQDSNRGHKDFQSFALPAELDKLFFKKVSPNRSKDFKNEESVLENIIKLFDFKTALRCMETSDVWIEKTFFA